jgi:hypothetical protein
MMHPLQNFSFNFNVRRYNKGKQQKVETIEGSMISLPPGVYLEIESVPAATSASHMVRQCRLTLSDPR